MKHADKLTKYVVAIDHKSGYEKGFTYYPLKSKEKAIAFAEAATQAMKAKEVFCWTVLKRAGKVIKVSQNVSVADYDKVRRFFPSGFSEKTSADLGGNKWGGVISSDIITD